MMGRLSTQRCLVDEDIDAVAGWMESFEAVGITCDMVMRTHSPDGISSWSTPERVREHASVPDVFITGTGDHVLLYNDVTPGLLEETLRADPARLWRQGLLGLGGMGMAIDEGAGFVEVDTLDLHLPTPSLVVDPDLGRRADG